MAKRIASSSVNWSLLNKHVVPTAKPGLMQLKNKADKYFRKVSDLPPELPKIDWSFYKNKITTPGLLETFQKQYESLQIPYPGDGGLIAEAEKLDNDFKKARAEEEITAKKILADTEAQLKEFSSRKKPSEMTKDEFQYTYPDVFKFDENIYPFDSKNGNDAHDKKDQSH